MSSKSHILLRLLALFLLLGWRQAAWAQFDPQPFIILDAEDRSLTDERGHVWDPEDGVWMSSSLSLPERRGLEVFVTHEVCADSVVTWSKSNDPQHRELVSAFVNEYRQRGWMIRRHETSYDLSDINVVAQEIYAQYPAIIDYWNELTNDPRGAYAMALVLHPEEGGPFEYIVLSEKVTKYDGEEHNCPLYYKNRTMLSNVVTVSRRPQFRRLHGSASSDGTWITFKEHFRIQGEPDERLVIDRIISTCNFERDLDVVRRSFAADPERLHLATRLLDYGSMGESHQYHLRPFVFAGNDFQRQLYRRTRGDMLCDTLEHYRLNTRSEMNSSVNWVEFREVEPDSMTYLVPQALWKLLLRYRSFDPIRNRILAETNQIPSAVLPGDTARAYTIKTPTPLFHDFRAYVDSGHVMSDHYVVRNEADLREGYVSRQNQMDIYPLLDRSRRVRIEHTSADTLQDKEPLALSRHAIDTLFNYRWQMPDPYRFYQLRHVNYHHDFAHADSSMTDECDCEREMPLQFLSLTAKTATFDCPPRLHIATDRLVSFKPRARGELTDATYSIHLTYALNSTELDLDLGDNRAQMDSLVQKAYEITHELNSRIQLVSVIGIASPEGTRQLNLSMSRGRSEDIIRKLRAMGGPELSHATFRVVKDSIAPWSAVADLIEADMPEYASTALRIRNAITGVAKNDFRTQQERINYSLANRHPAIDAALERLREAQVTYGYRTVLEATEQMVIDEFRSGKDITRMQPDYYYYLLMSRHTTHDEKVRVAKALLQSHATEVRRFATDQHPVNSFGLVLPIAANYLAQDSIRMGHFNRDILAPFINRDLFQGNVACYMNSDLETPVKFINLDVILFNQILTLCNIGTPDAMSEAYDLLDILNDTPTLSENFRRTYRPEQLELLLDSHNGRFLQDPTTREMMRQSNIRNLFVVNLADIYNKTDGRLEKINETADCAYRLQQCADSLVSLQIRYPNDPATWYFAAVTRLWQSESMNGADNEAYVDAAVNALFRLFCIENRQPYIARLQGDSYVRHIYRNPYSRRMHRDLYLEAVERYITHISQNP